jgi:site-specific recombinase XerD
VNSFHKLLDRRREAHFSPTLIMYAEAIGIRFLPEIAVDHVKEWRSQWKVGVKTAIKQWERVRQFFRYDVDAEWITKNPASKIRNW